MSNLTKKDFINRLEMKVSALFSTQSKHFSKWLCLILVIDIGNFINLLRLGGTTTPFIIGLTSELFAIPLMFYLIFKQICKEVDDKRLLHLILPTSLEK